MNFSELTQVSGFFLFWGGTIFQIAVPLMGLGMICVPLKEETLTQTVSYKVGIFIATLGVTLLCYGFERLGKWMMG